MKLSAEITLYPLQDDYLPIIKSTIEKLHSFNGISVETFPTATILVGDYSDVMAAVNTSMLWSYEQYGKCVFIVKFLPGYEAR